MSGPVPGAEDPVATLHALLAGQRVGYLASLGADGPYASMVPFAADPAGLLYVHLSGLARHTRNVTADPRVSLLVCEDDGPDKNPLGLVRVTLGGSLERLEPGTPAAEAARSRYLARFPQAETTLSLPDFRFWSLAPRRVHLVAGFGKARELPPETLVTP